MKPIKLTDALIRQMTEEFSAAIAKMKLTDGKVSYNKTLTYKDEEGVEILFEPAAYAKMLVLLNRFDKEVAWHGVVDRIDTKTFLISDILVYPQEVTGATVTTDQERYQQWLIQLDDDTFNRLHMQGHSHVNMGVTPSSVDTNFYDSIVEQLGDEDFYIFLIFNKKLEFHAKVYDLQQNTLYETADVSIGINCDTGNMESFISDAKKVVVERSYAVATTSNKAVGNVTPLDSTAKKKETASTSAKANTPASSSFSQCPGYYGSGYGGYGYGYGGRQYGRDETDFDEEIFGPRDTVKSESRREGKKSDHRWHK